MGPSDLGLGDDVHGFEGESHVRRHVRPDEVLQPRLSTGEQAESSADHHDTAVHPLLHLIRVFSTANTPAHGCN